MAVDRREGDVLVLELEGEVKDHPECSAFVRDSGNGRDL